MHEAEGRAQGLSYVYTLLDTEMMGETAPPLDELVTFAEHFGFTGFNVTFPYKQEIIPLLDELSGRPRSWAPSTRSCSGAANASAITPTCGVSEKAFAAGMAGAKRSEALLLGAGGAGAAVAHALLESGVERLLVTDVQTRSRGGARITASVVRRRANVEVVSDLAAGSRRADGIVNATPVGMAKLPGMPIAADLLRPECWVADIVYFPLETELLAQARSRGCRTLSGEGMAVFQAVQAFELFTGISPDADRMKTAFAAFSSAPAG